MENQNRKQKKPLDLQTIVYGKVPPQARNLEESLLGAIMLESEVLQTVLEVIKHPAVFYADSNQKVFKAILSLDKKNQAIDQLTVIEELRTAEELDIIGGPFYIHKLTTEVTSSAHCETWAKIVFERFIKREIIRVAGTMVNEAFEDSTDTFELLDEFEKKVLAISEAKNNKEVEHLTNYFIPAIQDLQKKIQRHNEGKSSISGVTSGFPSIDRITHGWQPSDLIILAARPSVGKTAFALNLARNAALPPPESNLPKTAVAIFSLEMSAQQLVERLWSSEANINLDQIKKGRLEEHEQEKLHRLAIQPLAEANIYVDDTPALNIFELRAKCRRLKNKFGVGLIIIDYLQLMSGTGERNSNREQEISNISRSLKALAKELKLPIIALSQLSREVEKRGDKNKMPILSDLRESGAIEQDADSVLFIYRPEYHNIHHNGSGESNVGETNIRFAKHRNGILDTVKLKAQLWIQKFVEWEDVNGFTSPLNQGKGLYNIGPNTKVVNPQLEDNPDQLPF